MLNRYARSQSATPTRAMTSRTVKCCLHGNPIARPMLVPAVRLMWMKTNDSSRPGRSGLSSEAGHESARARPEPSQYAFDELH